MGYMCLFQYLFPRGVCLEVGLLGLMVVLFLVKPSVDFLLSLTVIFSYRLSVFFFFFFINSHCLVTFLILPYFNLNMLIYWSCFARACAVFTMLCYLQLKEVGDTTIKGTILKSN